MKQDKPISARFTKEAFRQLKFLSKKWGENISRTLIRCVAIVFEREK